MERGNIRNPSHTEAWNPVKEVRGLEVEGGKKKCLNNNDKIT